MANMWMLFALVGITYAQGGYDLPVPAPSGYSYNAPELRAEASRFNLQEEDPLAALAAIIPGGGVPRETYPILASVPDTGFSCQQQEYTGYFADTADDAGCQVFHICQFDGRQDSFLCPNGTIFNQQYFVCDWWFNVDCSATEQFVRLNADIGVVPVDAEASFKSEVVAPEQLYGTPEVRDAAPAPPPQSTNFYNAPNTF